MKRAVELRLDAWLARSAHHPLVLRGARQVGKTWLVRDLAARAGRQLVEINFERNPALKRLFRQPAGVIGDDVAASFRAEGLQILSANLVESTGSRLEFL